MKTAILLLIFVVGAFATPLSRREYEQLDVLLRDLLERDNKGCQDSDFGVMGFTCGDYLRDLFDGKLNEMCKSPYYKDHCCKTCSA